MIPLGLAYDWRAKATDLRRYGADAAAATLEACAIELEEAWRIWETEPLTLEVAENESGYSYSALQSMVSAGRLQNIGKKHSPRVCRADLPRKPRVPERVRVDGAPDLAGEILSRRAAS